MKFLNLFVERKELPHKITVEISSREEGQLEEMVRLLRWMDWCCAVGHSGTTKIFVDGDGAGSLHIDRLPDTDAKEFETGDPESFSFGE